jgi:hypothetical protein
MSNKDARLVSLQVYGPLGLNLREKMKHGCLCIVVDSFYRSDTGVPYCAEASRRIMPNDIIERVDGVSMLNTSMATVNEAIKTSIKDHKLFLQVRDKQYFTPDMANEALSASARKVVIGSSSGSGGGGGAAGNKVVPPPNPKPAPAPKPAPVPAPAPAAANAVAGKRAGPPVRTFACSLDSSFVCLFAPCVVQAVRWDCPLAVCCALTHSVQMPTDRQPPTQ